MTSPTAPLLQGKLLTVQAYSEETSRSQPAGTALLLEVADDASETLLASLPLLDQLLSEKLAAVRERRMEEMVEFMASKLLAPSRDDVQMAQRLAARHAQVLEEFGFFTAEQLGEANGSRAASRSALVDNWRKRRQVFAVPHPERGARERDVYPAFQFDGGRPRRVVQDVLEAFAGRKSPWKLALWFASGNGALPGSARPVDLLERDPESVAEAARRDAAELGA